MREKVGKGKLSEKIQKDQWLIINNLVRNETVANFSFPSY